MEAAIIPELQPKRQSGCGGLDALYPYYAGFSYDFVRELLALHKLTQDAVILDPWNGSGTTTAATQRFGYRSLGLDLNPFASLVAKAKIASANTARRALNRATIIADELISGPPRRCRSSEPLLAWMPPASASLARSIIDRLRPGDNASTLSCLLTIGLAKACRKLLLTKPSSNPTWTTPTRIPRLPRRTLLQTWTESMVEISHLIIDNPGFSNGPQCTISTGDARNLPLPDNSVDIVLSSPPYCTRIDYAVKTRLELDLLGIFSKADFRTFRCELMGTTAIRSQQSLPRKDPRSLKQLLETVRSHPSHGASAYYFPWLRQYFSDAMRSLNEINRVLRRGGIVYLVLQNSYFKTVHIDLPTLYIEMGKAIGMTGVIVSSKQVARNKNKASVNPKVRQYADNRSYYEALVRLEAANGNQSN